MDVDILVSQMKMSRAAMYSYWPQLKVADLTRILFLPTGRLFPLNNEKKNNYLKWIL